MNTQTLSQRIATEIRAIMYECGYGTIYNNKYAHSRSLKTYSHGERDDNKLKSKVRKHMKTYSFKENVHYKFKTSVPGTYYCGPALIVNFPHDLGSQL